MKENDNVVWRFNEDCSIADLNPSDIGEYREIIRTCQNVSKAWSKREAFNKRVHRVRKKRDCNKPYLMIRPAEPDEGALVEDLNNQFFDYLMDKEFDRTDVQRTARDRARDKDPRVRKAFRRKQEDKAARKSTKSGKRETYLADKRKERSKRRDHEEIPMSYEAMERKARVKAQQEQRKSRSHVEEFKRRSNPYVEETKIATPAEMRGGELVKKSGFTKSESRAYREQVAQNKKNRKQRRAEKKAGVVRPQSGFVGDSCVNVLTQVDAFYKEFVDSWTITDFPDLLSQMQLNGTCVSKLVRGLAFCYALYRSRNTWDVLNTVVLMDLPKFFGSDYSVVSDFIISHKNSIYEWAVSGRSGGECDGEESKVFTQSGEIKPDVKVIDIISSMFNSILSASLFTALREFILGVFSTNMFGRDISHKVTRIFGVTHGSFINLITLTLTAVQRLMEFGSAIIQGRPVFEALLEQDPAAKLVTKTRETLAYADFIYTGLPIEGYKSNVVYETDLRDCITGLQSILPTLSPYSLQKKEVRDSLFKAQIGMASLQESIGGGGTRVAPMALLLSGKPGIGKGHLMIYLSKLWSEVKGREFHSQQIFSKNPNSEYWETYMPGSQPIVKFTEVGRKCRSAAIARGDDQLEELVSIVDTLPYPVNTAFKDKGKVYCRPELVLADTNNPDLNLAELYACPAAYKRRFICIEPTVLPEFRKENSCSIDAAKSLQADGHKLDRYTFDVCSYTATEQGYRKYEILSKVRLPQFTQTLMAMMTTHVERGEAIKVEMDEMQICLPVMEDDSSGLFDDVKNYDPGEGDVPFVDVVVKRKRVWRTKKPPNGDDDSIQTESGIVIDKISSTFSLVKNRYTLVKTDIKEKLRDSPGYQSFKNFVNPAINTCFTILKDLVSIIVLYVLANLFSTVKVRTMRTNIFTVILTSWALYSQYYLFGLMINMLRWMWMSMKTPEPLQFITVTIIREVCRRKCKRLRHFWDLKPYNYFADDNRTATYVKVACFCAILSCFFSKKFFDRFASKVTGEPVKAEAGPFLTVLKNTEIESYGAGSQLKRVKVNGTNYWNDRVIPVEKVAHTGDPIQLSSCVTSNVRYCRLVRDSGKTIQFYVLGISKGYAITNKHNFTGIESNSGELLMSCTSGTHIGGNGWNKIRFYPGSMCDLGNDLVMLDTKQRFKDVTAHFTDNIIRESASARIAGVSTRTYRGDGVQKALHDNGEEIEVSSYLSYKLENHKPGMCGLPIVSEYGKGAIIAGIHYAGRDRSTDAFGAVITRSDIDKGISELDKRVLFSIHSESGVYDQIYEEPISKSITRFEFLQNLDYFGKLPGAVILDGNSRLRTTKIASEVNSFFSNRLGLKIKKFGRPLMQPRVRHGEYQSPYNMALTNIAKTREVLRDDILLLVVRRLTRRIILGLEEKGIQVLHPLTISEAINGVTDDAFIRRVNASASAGFGYPGVKSTYLPIEIGDERTVLDEVAKRLLDIEEIYNAGSSCHFVYKAKLKDEARTIEKCENGKTRVFYMSPLDGLLMSRRFLMPFYTLMLDNNELFCTAVGIDMHRGADSLYRRLNAFSSNFIEGDYGKYDQCMPIGVGHAVSRVISDVLSHFGYTELAMRQVNGLLTDNLYPYVEILQDVFGTPGLQPSGKFATAEDNSLRGLILLMYAWELEGLTEIEGDFFDFVMPVTYGDDVLAACKSEKFTSKTYATIVEREYGMSFTSSDKGVINYDFLTCDEISFLKRTFTYTQRFGGRYVAPLDASSMVRALSWYIPSDYKAEDEQVFLACTSMLWEFALYSPEYFSEFRNLLIKLLVAHYNFGDAELLKGLPSFRSIEKSIVGEEVTAMVTESPDWQTGDYSFGVTPEMEVKTESFSGLATVAMLPDSAHEYDYNYRIADLTKKESIMNQINALEQRRDELFTELEESKTVDMILRSGQDIATAVRDPNLNIKKELKNKIYELFDIQVTLKRLKKVAGLNSFSIRTQSGAISSGDIDTIAMSTEQNFSDMAGDQFDEIKVGESSYAEIGQATKLSLDAFFERPIEIETFDLQVGSDVLKNYEIWDLYTLNPTIRAKLRNYAHFSADLHVRTTISGSPFHFGRVMLSYQPYGSSNETLVKLLNANLTFPTMKPLLMNYLSQSDGAVSMDVKSNCPVDMKIPFISPKPMFNLYNENSSTAISDITPFADMEHAGQFHFVTINPVASTSATPSTVKVQIIAWASNVKLGTSTGTHLAVTTESGEVKDEFTTGPVERISTSAATMMNYLSVVPRIAPLARASSMMFGAFADVAAIFGWSRPVLIDEPLLVKNQPYQNGAHTVGSETTYRITLDPKQELNVDPRCVASNSDEMTISSIASRMSYLTTFDWTVSQNQMDPIWLSRVSPKLDTIDVGIAETYKMPTAMSYAAAPFVYWNGTITYRIEVVVSAFHRGKLAIFSEPNQSSNLINTDLSTNKQYMTIIDIQETQTIEINVNWARSRAWCVMPTATTGQYGSTIIQNLPFQVNGYIGIMPFTGLQSPDGSSVPINIYVCCKDLRVNCLADRGFPDERVIRTQSGIVSTDNITRVDLNENRSMLERCNSDHFGEAPVSFRALLKRYVFTQRASLLSLVGPIGKITLDNQIMPDNALVYGSTLSRPMDLFTYLRYAYVGVRGSVRKRLHVHGDFPNMNYDQVKVTLNNPDLSASPSTLTYTVSEYGVSSINGSVTFMPASNGGIEFELPYYSPNLFGLSFADDLMGDASDNTIVALWARSYCADFDVYKTIGDVVVDEESASGEDFSFLRYQGAPYFTES